MKVLAALSAGRDAVCVDRDGLAGPEVAGVDADHSGLTRSGIRNTLREPHAQPRVRLSHETHHARSQPPTWRFGAGWRAAWLSLCARVLAPPSRLSSRSAE